MAPITTILHLTPFFSPNIGGVETHLDDLINNLDRLNYRNIILTYSPLTTITEWKKHEKFGHTNIYRFAWIGHNLFHKLEKQPLLNFLYITPYLLFRSIIWIIFNHPHIETIHSHGINAALIGVVIKKLFKVNKHVVSIYSTYDNVPLDSFSTKMLVWILNHSDTVLTQSNQSVTQLINLGVNQNIVFRYFHWIDLQRFVPTIEHLTIKSILFIGRMIPQKNAYLLAQVARKFPEIIFTFVGTGVDYVKIKSLNYPNIILLGDIPYSQLHQHYQSADLLCIPSKYAEGWGRVIMESIACGAPVISTNLGATTEAADNSVAIFIEPTRENLVKSISNLINHPKIYQQLVTNCRPFATKNYSVKNIEYITQHY